MNEPHPSNQRSTTPHPNADSATPSDNNMDVVEVIEEAEARITASMAPNHRDMYILIAGLVVGFLLSPWCTGQFLSEEQFEHFYLGSGTEWRTLQDVIVSQQESVDNKIKDILERHKAIGATPGAEKPDVMRVQQQAREEQAEERKPFVDDVIAARQKHSEWLHGAGMALILAVAVLMFIEPVFEPLGTLAPLRNGLATGRYALAAAWLVLFVGQPHMRVGLNVVFAVILVAVAVSAAIAPWFLFKRQAANQ